VVIATYGNHGTSDLDGIPTRLTAETSLLDKATSLLDKANVRKRRIGACVASVTVREFGLRAETVCRRRRRRAGCRRACRSGYAPSPLQLRAFSNPCLRPCCQPWRLP